MALGKEEATPLDQEELIIGENYSLVVCLEHWITEDYTICLKMRADSWDAKLCMIGLAIQEDLGILNLIIL